MTYVASVLDSLRVSSAQDSNTADWWDTTIDQFFQARASLPWMDELCSPFAPKDVVGVLRAWRSGIPVSEIEAAWSVSDKPRKNRIEIGDYLNHSASLIAQFWGLAPVLAGTDDVEDGGGVRQLAACIREGVPSVEALIWLRALGGLDRFLATRLSALELLRWNSYSIRRKEAARLLNEWEMGEPSPLSPLEQAALEGVLHEETLLSAVTDAGPGPTADA